MCHAARTACCALVVLALTPWSAGSIQAAVDSVESLSRDPARLKVVLRECRSNAQAAEDPRCRAAREVWRRQFFGARKESSVKAPSSVTPPDSTPMPKASP